MAEEGLSWIPTQPTILATVPRGGAAQQSVEPLPDDETSRSTAGLTPRRQNSVHVRPMLTSPARASQEQDQTRRFHRLMWPELVFCKASYRSVGHAAEGVVALSSGGWPGMYKTSRQRPAVSRVGTRGVRKAWHFPEAGLTAVWAASVSALILYFARSGLPRSCYRHAVTANLAPV